MEISVVSVPANAYSTFGLEASTKSFFDNLEKDWKNEVKNLEKSAEIGDENSETQEIPQNEIEPQETAENDTNTDIPASGDELQDMDNVANEVLLENQENAESENLSDNSDDSDAENAEDSESEKSFGAENKNLETEEKSQNILESAEYKELLQKSEEYKDIAKKLVAEVEARDVEIAELKNILAKIPSRKGLVNVGNSPAQMPKQKGYIEQLIEEANQF